MKGPVDISQSVVKDEVIIEDGVVLEEVGVIEDGVVLEEPDVTEEGNEIRDEGYQSALDCTTCKNSLLKIEESYKQQIAALELELIHKQNRIDKYYFIKNELSNDEENFLEGKGKGGKGYVRKGCGSKWLSRKQQYLSKIRSDDKRHFRYLQLDHNTQYMICKIDALRESGCDNIFIDELLDKFEGMSFQLERLKETVKEMEELKDEYAKTIDELMHKHRKATEEKDQEINYLRKNVQVVLVENRSGFLGELSKSKKKSKKQKSDESDDEYQITIANMEALRELDYDIYGNVVKMFGWQKWL